MVFIFLLDNNEMCKRAPQRHLATSSYETSACHWPGMTRLAMCHHNKSILKWYEVSSSSGLLFKPSETFASSHAPSPISSSRKI